MEKKIIDQGWQLTVLPPGGAVCASHRIYCSLVPVQGSRDEHTVSLVL